MINTHNWYVGMPVIMTVDSGKGEIYHLNGEYKGAITQIDRDGIKAKFENLPSFWFEKSGICSGVYSGMSIRPAEEKGIDESITPSQWIEGMPTKEGHYWVENKDNSFAAITWTLPRYIPQNSSILRHCPISELPPPPPVKEVEAYGMLSAIDKLILVDTPVTESIVQKISLYRNFYSQPATAEVLEKYIGLRGSNIQDSWVSGYPSLSLDQFINWYSKEYRKLLFTAAALKELGVK